MKIEFKPEIKINVRTIESLPPYVLASVISPGVYYKSIIIYNSYGFFIIKENNFVYISALGANNDFLQLKIHIMPEGFKVAFTQ